VLDVGGGEDHGHAAFTEEAVHAVAVGDGLSEVLEEAGRVRQEAAPGMGGCMSVILGPPTGEGKRRGVGPRRWTPAAIVTASSGRSTRLPGTTPC
jgi:hypothetical protein